MARSGDLAEAHAHVRRHLGAALVAGDPAAGVDHEPERTGRRLVVGLLLTAVLLGGAAAGRLVGEQAGTASSPACAGPQRASTPVRGGPLVAVEGACARRLTS